MWSEQVIRFAPHWILDVEDPHHSIDVTWGYELRICIHIKAINKLVMLDLVFNLRRSLAHCQELQGCLASENLVWLLPVKAHLPCWEILPQLFLQPTLVCVKDQFVAFLVEFEQLETLIYGCHSYSISRWGEPRVDWPKHSWIFDRQIWFFNGRIFCDNWIQIPNPRAQISKSGRKQRILTLLRHEINRVAFCLERVPC